MSNSIKSKKFHFIYKTTNLRNGRFYIGMHSTNNLKDGYLGSGSTLRKSIRKHGPENFKIEIMEWCDTREILAKRETEIITEEFLNDKNCYNIKPGGFGGFNNTEHQLKCSRAAGLLHGYKLSNDIQYKESYSKKISEANKRRYEKGNIKPINENYDWKGKKHKPETIEKMRNAKKNYNIGTKWINDGKTNKQLKKGETLPKDWTYGRVRKTKTPPSL